ncbi:MAG: sigma-54-dependent Fis family transcriptional regulator [Deltaproteobacteria bacterium]|nr:sigma-54-dependent Fis family transcriptional regulator [Deltaproteobacteria bacterium]
MAKPHGQPEDTSAAARERDLYLRLLKLGRERELTPFLKEALALFVDLADARLGYLELYDGEQAGGKPGWWIAHGFADDEIEAVRGKISRGIIAEALATGEIVVTPSAVLDPRFEERDSVQASRIEAVLCAPIGTDHPRGVLYLQGPAGSGLFSEAGCAQAEIFTLHIEPFVERLIEQEHRRVTADPTLSIRQHLRVDGIVGRSAALAEVLRQVELAAPLEINVLLTGETGTGKSQLARAIHDNSRRAAQPLIEVNCGSLPESLVENELFGALPGAHSTAVKRIVGKVAAAENGTLFLDEVSDLPLGAQAKLLQLLQSHQYYPLGADTPVQADVRVIAATNTDLQRAVAEQRFREDLFYRLHVLPIRVPALAERCEDIPELVQFFCASASARHQLPLLRFSANALRALATAPWPGNIRQLANAVEAAVIRAAGQGVSQIECAHVFPETAESRPAATMTFQEATRRFQASFLTNALNATDWNITETAQRLDLARSHLYALIRALGLRGQQ